MTIFQKHIEQVGFTYAVTNETSGSVRCEKCQSDLAVTDWTDDIEDFYLKTAKETVLEKTSKHYTWLAKLIIALVGILLLTIVSAFIFSDEIKAHNAAKKLAEENRQDIVLQLGNEIELTYENLYLNAVPGKNQGAGVQWFEVVREAKKTYLLRKIENHHQPNKPAGDQTKSQVNIPGEKLFELKKAKSDSLGFTVVGLNGADGLYYNSEITKVEK